MTTTLCCFLGRAALAADGAGWISAKLALRPPPPSLFAVGGSSALVSPSFAPLPLFALFSLLMSWMIGCRPSPVWMRWWPLLSTKSQAMFSPGAVMYSTYSLKRKY